jgi:hypothetical protein
VGVKNELFVYDKSALYVVGNFITVFAALPSLFKLTAVR